MHQPKSARQQSPLHRRLSRRARALRAAAMQAFVGIRASDVDQTDATTLIRRLRNTSRTARLNP